MLKELKSQKNVKTSKSRNGFLHEFSLYRIPLWPCGLWPLEKRSLHNTIRYFLAVFSQMFNFAIASIEIYKNCGNAADALDNYAVSIVCFISFVKIICVRLHFKRVRNNYFYARDNWIKIADDTFIDIMKRQARVGKRIFHVQMVIAYCIVLQYVANPIFLAREHASNLPIQSECSFMNLSSMGYYSVYLMESIGLVYLAFGFIGVDVLFFGIVAHLCGQIEILQKEFNRIGKSMWSVDSVRLVKNLVEKHCTLKKLTEDVKITFSIILWLQFVVSTFLITSQSVTFILALKVHNIFLAIKCSQAFPVLFMQLFFYCYAGQLLKHGFGNITYSLYNSYWYLLPPKIRHYYLVYTMSQANQSFDLTAGSMFRVNMSTFISFSKSIFSFFSILLLVFEKNYTQ